ncbi:branched-chain amino acid ABC transporter permease [Haloarcula salina]|uniref:Branched-chain amino acid ABC transporter permease n=1 Tax=Haloarcula salina TaxID=1429914 RepID=A0AA41KJV9_9EURY|nr:branched-chain amino acid ABC transporter permease [Haloarcula salina]MBV0903173.1 branched-chain amino acid ABC transporter permease [Haloarcula salina]
MAVADFLITLVTFIAIYSLFGIGLNLKFGFTGLIDFGHVAYFMVGAYVTVVLTLPADAATYGGIGGFDLPGLFAALGPLGSLFGWVLGVVGGMVAAALVSLAVGVPTLRLREDYLAITALGIATILNTVVKDEDWLFNGPYGISGIHKPLVDVFPLSLGSFTVNMAVFGLLSVAVFAYVAYWLVNRFREAGRTGRIAMAVSVGLVSLWYFVMPAIDGGTVELTKNVLWLFDPTAGPNGGLDYDRFVLILAVGFLAGGYHWVERTINSPYGRVLRAIREDEDVPQALGKETFQYKMQGLMFGSALAGAAGALWAVNIGFVSPDQFASTITFFAFTAVIIGGTANNKGVILGTTVFWAIRNGTRFIDVPSQYSIQLAAARLILIGAILIVILYYRPQGLLGEQDYDIDLPGSATGGSDDV